MAPSRDEEEWARAVRQAGRFIAIPTLLAAGPLVGFFIGRGLDAQWHTAPWGLVGGLLLGFAAAVRETIRLIRRAMQESNRES